MPQPHSGTVIKGKMPQHAELLQEVAGSGIPYDVTFKICKRFWESEGENEEEGEGAGKRKGARWRPLPLDYRR